MDNGISKTDGKRNSSFELLRIVSILMIIMHHFAVHTGFDYAPMDLSIPRIRYDLLLSGGKVGVNCFVLISGYFLSANPRSTLRPRRIFNLMGQCVFYSVSIYLLACATGVNTFGFNALVRAFFPITNALWWFASVYFFLYLMHPFINRLIYALDRRAYRNLLMCLIVLWSIVSLIVPGTYPVNRLLWFITLYLLAGYIRLYGLNPRYTARRYALFFVLFSLLRLIAYIGLSMASTKIPAAERYMDALFEMHTILTLLTSLSLFMVFEKHTIRYSRIINTVASATFGVYLIHDHVSMRTLLWKNIFNGIAYRSTPAVVIYPLISVAIVYALCTLIEWARQCLSKKLFLRLADRYGSGLLKPLKAAIRILRRWLFGAIPDSKGGQNE